MSDDTDIRLQNELIDEWRHDISDPNRPLHRRMGVVTAVSTTDKTCSVQLAGSTTAVSGLLWLDHVRPTVNAIVWLIEVGGDYLIIGTVNTASTFTSLVKTSGVNTATSGPCIVDAFSANGGDMTLPAVAGDLLQFTYHSGWTNNATVFGYFDVICKTSGIYWSSGTSTGLTEGLRGLGANVTAVATFGVPGGGTSFYVAASGDLSGGSIIVKPRIGASANNRGLDVSTAAKFFLRNLGRP